MHLADGTGSDEQVVANEDEPCASNNERPPPPAATWFQPPRDNSSENAPRPAEYDVHSESNDAANEKKKQH